MLQKLRNKNKKFAKKKKKNGQHNLKVLLRSDLLHFQTPGKKRSVTVSEGEEA